MMHLKTVSKYIRRSPYQAIAASLIMSLTFLSVAVFAILTIVSIRTITYFETKPQLSIFFKDEATAADIAGLRSQLENTGKIESIKFVSKEEALSIYKQQNKEDPLLLDLVTSNILPASIDVQAHNVSELSDLARIAKGSDKVEQVIFQQDIVDTLIKWTSALRKIGLAIISVLLLVSIFVILTIIGIKITVRRDEIEIMKLIGASNWFIRTPFILEGIFYGVVGAIVGWGVSYAVLQFYAAPHLASFLSSVPVLPIEPLLMLEVLGGMIISAVILGAFSSFLAVLRYLK